MQLNSGNGASFGIIGTPAGIQSVLDMDNVVQLCLEGRESPYEFGLKDCTTVQISQVFGISSPFLMNEKGRVFFAKGANEAFTVPPNESYTVKRGRYEKRDVGTDTSLDHWAEKRELEKRQSPSTPLPPLPDSKQERPRREHSVSPEKKRPTEGTTRRSSFKGEKGSAGRASRRRLRKKSFRLKTTDVKVGCTLRCIGSYEGKEKAQLSLNVGDLIVLLAVDESGWWKGRVGDVVGWFPSKYCELEGKKKEEEEPGRKRADSGKKKEEEPGRKRADSGKAKKETEKLIAIQAGEEIVEALGDWKAQTEAQMGFAEGECLRVLEKHINGWWLAERLDDHAGGKTRGWVPSNYMQAKKPQSV